MDKEIDLCCFLFYISRHKSQTFSVACNSEFLLDQNVIDTFVWLLTNHFLKYFYIRPDNVKVSNTSVHFKTLTFFLHSHSLQYHRIAESFRLTGFSGGLLSILLLKAGSTVRESRVLRKILETFTKTDTILSLGSLLQCFTVLVLKKLFFTSQKLSISIYDHYNSFSHPAPH